MSVDGGSSRGDPRRLPFVLIGAGLSLALIAFFAWRASVVRPEQAELAQSAYLEHCAEEGRDVAVCQRDIDAHGDECSRIGANGSGVEGGAISHTIYQMCLELTPDGWRVREADRRRARRELMSD